MPSRSFANPCNVLHEFPHSPAIGLSLPLLVLPAPIPAAFTSPLELTGLLSLSLGIGLPPLLPNGLGSGLAALVVGAVLALSSASLLSPFTSLRPEMRRRLRGRREDADAGVELVRTSLACISGDVDYYADEVVEPECQQAEGGRAAAMACVFRIDVLIGYRIY